jgi:hypothetical protein
MQIKIKPYSKDMIEPVIDFNQRLAKEGLIFKLPKTNIPEWLPKIENRNIYQEYFLAIQNDSIVRGGYTLKHQEFSFNGEIISIGVARAPLSEGIIDNAFNLVALQLLTDALKKQPLLYGLGLSGGEEPINKIYRTLGWPIISVPFYFKVNNPSNFLRDITFLRRTRFNKLLFDCFAITGIGFIVIKLIQYLLRKVENNENSLSIEIVEEFSMWADKLWEECKNKFSMIAVRDSNVLNILYPRDNDRFIRLKISFKDCVIGWVIVLNTQMSNHKQFGDMRVGSIIDCLALPQNASRVLICATKYLEKAGVDLIISNQTHHSWCSALKNAGFFNGPSNFNFTASKKLIKLLNYPAEIMISNMHLNRGDCDGPINL